MSLVYIILNNKSIVQFNNIVSFEKSFLYCAIACVQALWGSLAARKEKGGELETMSLWNLNSTSNFPVALRRLSCQFSANHCEAEISANVNEHLKTRAKDNDVITYVISANEHFTALFRCRYSNSRIVVASSPSFSRPAARVPRRACSQASCPMVHFT